MIDSLLGLAQSGGLDGDLLTSKQFFQTDYTKPLLFMADGGRLEERAEKDHLLGEQWGMMNETGSSPGRCGCGCTPSRTRSNPSSHQLTATCW